MTTLADWYGGARPKTLPAAIAPVLLGSAVAFWERGFAWLPAMFALIVALALQVGVNYANDYSDGIRGTDDDRVGPIRLVGQGLASPSAVKRAAYASFTVAAVAGLTLTIITGHWIFIPIGALAILSAWFYTGGPRPYGYLGLGEVFVFVWFGLAAVLGTTYAQIGRITALSLVLAVGSGGFACALLMVNNLRDLPKDAAVGKRTLAVRVGDGTARRLYVAMVWSALVASVWIGASAFLGSDWPLAGAAGLLAALPAHRPGRQVLAGAGGRDLIDTLVGTGRAQMTWSLLTAVGMIWQTLLG